MTDTLLEVRALLADHRLALEFDPVLTTLVERWLPRVPLEAPAPRRRVATIRAESASGEILAEPEVRPLLTLGTVRLWLPAGETRAELRGKVPGTGGSVDLAGLEARLAVPADDPAALADLYSMLTLSAALLLGRLGRTPIHAAAVLPPSGRALVLVGDARVGKSTTTVNLITAGWGYLSDDQIVLAEDGAGLRIEGWPRLFHLDEGWEAGMPTGVRRSVDGAAFGPGRWQRSAPLGGLLFPMIVPDEPTRLEPIPAALAFAGLVRQAPWLLVDRGSSETLLRLLSEAACLPAYRLVLGLDTYRDPDRLVRCLDEAARAVAN